MPWQEWICGVSDEGVGILRVGRNLKYAPYDEECPGTFRHLGYYEKINLIASLNVFKVYQLIMNKV